MSDQLENMKPEDLSSGDRPLSIPPELPILPLRDTVLFPNSFMPLAVARESSVRLIDDAITNGKLIAVFTQRDASVEEPGQADLYPVGTATHIHKMFKLPDGSLRLIVQGLSRLTLNEIVSTHPYLRAKVTAAVEGTTEADALEIDALARNIKTNFQQVVSLSPLLSDDLQTLATNINEPGRLADFIASSLSTISTAVKQEVLETLDIRARMDNLNRILIKELEVLELGSKIQSQVQSEVGKNQRDYFLREQLKAIQKELGEGDDQTKEIEELAEKIEAVGMPEAVKKEALRELDRLSKMPVAAAEYTVSRTYLDWLVALPWNKRTDEVIDLPKTKAVLDADHSGLEKVKDRILEYLAVRKLNPEREGADPLLRRASRRRQDVAGALDRDVARPEVRARVAGRHARRSRDPRAPPHVHRRAAGPDHPGPAPRGVEEPGVHPRRDRQARLGFPRRPASALLEVLDPEQNNTFRDHYLDVPFDLSEVLFITTANVLDPIPAPLRDRMEVLELPGYTEEEKLQDRARSPRGQTGQEPRPDRRARPLHAEALRPDHSRLHPRSGRPQPRARDRLALPQGRRRRAEAPTEGSWPRQRHSGRRRGDARRAQVPRRGNGRAHQGSGRGDRPRLDAGRRRSAVHRGVADGGHRLADADRPARRRDEGVGARGAVVAARCAPWRTQSIPISTRTPKCTHVPSGAIPKDGPSAGVTMVCALASQLTGRPVRGDIAMTGEITLSGRVLPVGGIKEKVLAARRLGIHEVILPKQNAKNVNEDLTPELRKDLTIHLVSTIDEVLALALQHGVDGPAAHKKEPKSSRQISIRAYAVFRSTMSPRPASALASAPSSDGRRCARPRPACAAIRRGRAQAGQL